MRNMRTMRNKGVALAVAALVLGLFAGCVATKGETAGQYIDDASITTSVKAKLAADNTQTLTRVSVDTVRGTVYLTGIVSSSEAKQRARELAGQVKGVQQVVNNIQVQGG
jgi:hyperosmotically inducible periplasmic protein